MKIMNNALIKRLDIVVLLTCLCISYGIWQYGLINDRSSLSALEDKSHDVSIALAEEFENTVAYIDAVRGIYVASENISDLELSRFMQSTSQTNLSSSVLRINYIEAVSNEDIKDKALIVPGFDKQFFNTQSVDKSGKLYEPSNINFLNEEVRRKAIELILKGSETVIVRVNRIENVAEYSGEGLIFLVPVYRENQLTGVVDALISGDRIKEIIDELTGEEYGWVMYEDNPNDKVMHNEQHLSGELESSTRKIMITDDVFWYLEIKGERVPSSSWNYILGAGVMLSFVIYVVVYALSSANSRAYELARQMTLDLEKYKLALDNASNHVVITDENGVVLYANKAAQKMTGFPIEEILGKTPRLWGRQMPKEFYEKFWHQIKAERRVFSGVLRNKRKNGELYEAAATVSPIIDENHNLVGFVGVEEDVTDERKIQAENLANLEKLSKFNELMIGRELKMVELKKQLSQLKDKVT